MNYIECFIINYQTIRYMKKALLQILIIVVSLIVGYCIGRSKHKKNVAVEFVYEGQTLTSQSESKTFGEEEPYGDSYVVPIKNGTILKNGAIPDAKTAYEVAYPILCAVYGESMIRKELPLKVYLVDNKWRLVGSWNHGAGVKGGVAAIVINKSDGRVLDVVHSE